MARHPFAAVNLISDPIHGYLELTKRLSREESTAAGLPDEDAAEDDLLDTAWLQRLRRISQLQSARWVFPTAEHSRFTHGLGVMHEAGLWARALMPSLRTALPSLAPGEPLPSEGLVVETLRMAGLLHDVGHGPFAHFFDDRVLAAFPAPADARRGAGGAAKRLSHEDLSQLIIERELGGLIRALRRAPGASPERDAFSVGESIDPRWVSFLVSKPALVDASMPAWVRLLQPLLSGVFTVDNLDYVRRDAFFTGVRVGIDVERLRRYAFISERGLTLYEPGVAALEGFLNARLLLHQAVYFHRTVRAIDLDLAEVFQPAIEALFGDDSPAERLSDYVDLDEYALLHQAARWARGEDIVDGERRGGGSGRHEGAAPNSSGGRDGGSGGRDGGSGGRDGGRGAPGGLRVSRAVADGWRGILLRRPGWRAEAEFRASYEPGAEPSVEIARLGQPEPGRVAIDLAVVDSRPSSADRLAIEGRDGRDIPLAKALERVPAFAVIGRRYRRI